MREELVTSECPEVKRLYVRLKGILNTNGPTNLSTCYVAARMLVLEIEHEMKEGGAEIVEEKIYDKKGDVH